MAERRYNMFVSVKSIVELIKSEHKYHMEATLLPQERIPEGYFENGLNDQIRRLDYLKRVSCNEKLIDQMTKLIDLEKSNII